MYSRRAKLRAAGLAAATAIVLSTHSATPAQADINPPTGIGSYYVSAGMDSQGFYRLTCWSTSATYCYRLNRLYSGDGAIVSNVYRARDGSYWFKFKY